MFNKVILSAAAAASLFAACASAICPGYDYGIAQADTGVCKHQEFQPGLETPC